MVGGTGDKITRPYEGPQSKENIHVIYTPKKIIDAANEFAKQKQLARDSELYIKNSEALFKSIRAHFGLGEEVGLRHAYINNHNFPSTTRVRGGKGVLESLFGKDTEKPLFTGKDILENKGCHLGWQPVTDYLVVRPKISKDSDQGFLVSYSDWNLAKRDNPHSILTGAYAFACAKILSKDKIKHENIDSLHSIVGLEIHSAGFTDHFYSFLNHLSKSHPGFNVTTGNFMHKINPYG